MTETPSSGCELQCLWLTREYPYPANAGDLIYSRFLAESFAEAGADLTVLCRDTPDGVDSPKTPPPSIAWKRVSGKLRKAVFSLLSSLPSLPHRYATRRFRSALEKLLRDRKWQVVLIDHLGMGWVLEVLNKVLPSGPRQPPVVFVSHNHEETARLRMAKHYRGNFLKRAALFWDAKKAGRLERVLVESADLVTVNTLEDRALFARSHPEKRYLVLTPGYLRRVVTSRVITQNDPRRAVVLGSFDWLAKQIDLREFLELADPMFAAAGAALGVIGRAPEPFLADIRDGLQATSFTGAVEDISQHLDGARIGIVPERTGHGFKHKVLDYVFNRIPVAAVENSVTGMPLVPGESLLVYPDMAALCRGVLAVLDDVERLNQLQQSAFEKCLGQFDWQSRGRDLFDHVKALVALRSTV